jgi:hypothetical protein
MHSDRKKRRSFLALLFTAGDVKRFPPVLSPTILQTSATIFFCDSKK